MDDIELEMVSRLKKILKSIIYSYFLINDMPEAEKSILVDYVTPIEPKPGDKSAFTLPPWFELKPTPDMSFKQLKDWVATLKEQLGPSHQLALRLNDFEKSNLDDATISATRQKIVNARLKQEIRENAENACMMTALNKFQLRLSSQQATLRVQERNMASTAVIETVITELRKYEDKISGQLFKAHRRGWKVKKPIIDSLIRQSSQIGLGVCRGVREIDGALLELSRLFTCESTSAIACAYGDGRNFKAVIDTCRTAIAVAQSSLHYSKGSYTNALQCLEIESQVAPVSANDHAGASPSSFDSRF